MDPLAPAMIRGVDPAASGPVGVGRLPEQAAFQTVFQESLASAPAARPLDPASDMRAFGQQFRDLERTLQADRASMMRLIAPPASTGQAHGNSHGSHAQYGMAQGERGHFADGAGRMLSRDSDRIRPVYTDHSARSVSPVIHSALGVDPAVDVNRIDFAGEIGAVNQRLDGVMGAIRERIGDTSPKSPEQSIRHNSEVQALIREGDKLNTERSMMMSLHIAAHQETRTRMLSAFEHVTGMVKKINEIFNQLKQGS